MTWWESTARHNPIYADIFGNNPTVGPGLMGFVPAAAREPLFWLHHAYIDKTWSEWNASNNASYLYAESLRQSPWNYAFYKPSADGSPEKITYSNWGDGSNTVVANVYHPDYSYDELGDVAKQGSPNPVLALLNQPRYRPRLEKTHIHKSVSELAYQSVDLGSAHSIKARDILRLRALGINLTMELTYEVPMSAAQNIAVLVGDSSFLTGNKLQIRNLWESWLPGTSDGRGQEFNDPAWGSIYDSRSGSFAPTNLSNFAVGTVNLIPMSGALAAGQDMDSGSHEHGMQGHITVDLSDSIYRQAEFNLIKPDSRVAMMLAATDPDSSENSQTMIHNVDISLYKALKSGGDHKDSISGSDSDVAAYFAEHPDLLYNPKALRNPLRYYKTEGRGMGHKHPRLQDRAQIVGRDYLEANPDLNEELNSSPYKAIRHYLTKGMAEGRNLSLDPAQGDSVLSSNQSTHLLGDALCCPTPVGA